MIHPSIEEITTATYEDGILGICRIEAIYMSPAVAGGSYSYKGQRGFGSSSYHAPEAVIALAERIGLPVKLAGFDWELIGIKGCAAVEVPAAEARELLNKLRLAIVEKSTKFPRVFPRWDFSY